MEKNDELERNITDHLTSIVKSGVGFFPGIGTALGEIVSYLVPNQRLDRVAKYLYKINDKIETLSNEIKNNRDKINLIETGLKASANSIFDEKCEWIANVVIQGLYDDIDISVADNIINIVSQLNNEQIIILYYYVNYDNKPMIEKEPFIKRFRDLFDYGMLLSENREKFELLKNKEQYNTTTLLNIGLLKNNMEIDRLPNFGVSSSYSSNDIKMLQSQLYELNKNLIDYFCSSKYKATDLGTLVIKTMNLVDASF